MIIDVTVVVIILINSITVVIVVVVIIITTFFMSPLYLVAWSLAVATIIIIYNDNIIVIIIATFFMSPLYLAAWSLASPCIVFTALSIFVNCSGKKKIKKSCLQKQGSKW